MENVKLKIENELKPYDEYKDAGLLWLDKVPKHWGVKLNKYLWAERKTVNCIEEQLLSVTIKKGVISQSELLKSSSKKDSSNLDKSKYKLVMPNDIAYNKMRMWQGAVGVSNYRGIVSPAYIVLKSRKNINSRYYHFLLRSPIYIEESHRNSYGICDDQLSLRYEDFKRMQIIIPAKEEQDQIVSYLDSKISKINKFINAKKKQIELLKELKQAIINQAVTKGLDPNAKMKPSGIEWLGDIPEGWEVVKLRWLIGIKSGEMLKDGIVSDSLGFPMIGGNGIMGYTNITNCKHETLCIGRVGALCGNIHYIDYDCWITDNALFLYWYNKKLIDLKYLEHYLRFVNLNQYANKAAQPLITGELVKQQYCMVPDLNLQKCIVTYIENKTQTIDKSIEAIKKEISLITEYRTSLISNVVTGKVDVRHIEVEDAIEGLEQNLEDLEEENIDEEIEMGEEE